MTTTQLTDRNRHMVTATIANGQTTSEEIQTNGYAALGVLMPGAFTGTSLTLLQSFDGTTWTAVYDSDGGQVSISVAASRFIVLDPSTMAPLTRFKVVSGSSEAAERSLTFLMAEV
ncbi:MAG: hypothetical protein GY906_22435 [bacterium]|nr:hypothetical protein [bacterium]